MYVCMYVCCMSHAPREKPHAKRGVLGCRLASTATTCASIKALFKLYNGSITALSRLYYGSIKPLSGLC